MSDWTKRRAAGIALIGSALLSFAKTFPSSWAISYILPIVLILSGLAILAWDWRIHKSAQRQARLSVEFITEDFRKSIPNPFPFYDVRTGEVPYTVGFLLVHNTGKTPVKCHALITVNDGIKNWPSESTLAQWHNRRSSYVTIESGGTQKIVIAILRMGGWNYRWLVPYWLQEKPSLGSTEKFFRGEKSVERAHAHIAVIVKSDPLPSDGLPKCSLVIEGQEIKTV